jgi:hypothetical protein
MKDRKMEEVVEAAGLGLAKRSGDVSETRMRS